MEGATNAGGIGPSGSSSSQIPVGVDEEVPIEVTLRLLPATRGAHSTPQSADAKSDPPPVPLAKTAILGLPDLALAAPRALLLLSSRSAVPSSHSCIYGNIVVEGLVDEDVDRSITSEDDKDEGESGDKEKKAAASTAPQFTEPKLAFRFRGKEEEVFGRSLSPIEVITYTKDSQPIVTLVILNTCLGRWAAPQVASKLVAFLVDNGVSQFVLASALHFNPPPKFERKVHYLGLFGATRSSLFPSDQQELVDFDEKTPVREGFLSAITLFLRVEEIPTHCLLIKGYRVSRNSANASDESVRSLAAVLEKLVPVSQPDLGLLQALEPHEVPTPGPNSQDMRMYT